MKKSLAWVFAAICVLTLVSCGMSSQNTKNLQPVDNSVSEINRDALMLPVMITDRDADTLTELMQHGSWTTAFPDLNNDCSLNLEGHPVYYDSDRGTFSRIDLSNLSVYSAKEQETVAECLVLSEKDREAVNSIIKKYITLGAQRH